MGHGSLGRDSEQHFSVSACVRSVVLLSDGRSDYENGVETLLVILPNETRARAISVFSSYADPLLKLNFCTET